MNILFYAIFTGRSRDTEATMLRLKELGHNVQFMNLSHSDDLEIHLQKLGIRYVRTCSALNSKSDIIRNVVFLVKYCVKNNIQCVFSHLDPAHTVAVLAQFFLRAQVILVRHHANDVYLNGLHRNIVYRAIYFLARKVIVVSDFAKRFMISHEGVSAEKIDVIPLAYDLNNSNNRTWHAFSSFVSAFLPN